MELETEANPAPEDDTRPLETEAEAETDELDNETDGEPEVETIEVERGGVKYTIPKALEGELLMQSDYTKKTMTLAEEKKATEAEITAKREAIALREANVDLHANIKTLEAQKRQLEAIPGDRIQRLRAEDPAEYNRLVGDYQAVQTALANAKDQQTALHNELTSRAERAIATSHEKAIEEAARTIPDFLTRPMANTILTPTAVTREALRVLHQKLNFVGSITRDYDESFAKTGAKIGDSLKIRLPNQYTVRTGATLSAQDTTETSVTLQVATQKGVDLNFTSTDLTLSLDDFSKRIISSRRWRFSRRTSKPMPCPCTRTCISRSGTADRRRPTTRRSTPARSFSGRSHRRTTAPLT
jgi:hypothetical protein